MLEAFAELFGLTVAECADLLRTEEGRRRLGLTDSAPIEMQIRLLLAGPTA